MPKLKICGKDENGVIKVKNKDIEIFAYQQLSEYQKNYFDKPHKLDIDDFIEYYLNRNIRYCGLNQEYDKGKEVILGKTIIKEDITIIYSDDNEPIIKKLKLGTICVDEKACEKRERINFTLAHECWHSQFDLNLDISVMPVYSGHKFFFSDQKLKIVNIRSPEKWMDYHADKYAVYLLMPEQFVKQMYKDVSNFYRKTNDRIRVIAKRLGVSYTAIRFRLLELKLITEEEFRDY